MSKVTVFMPVYNAERYVADAINSILAQTFKDFSLIIIDDGSTDNSLAEIRRAVGRDPRCKVTSRENKGIVVTRNEGLRETFGEYLFLMDADDISHLTRLAEQVRYLDMNPECVALGTRMMLCDPDMLPIVEMIEAFDHDSIDSAHLNGDSAICNGSVGMRREAVVAAGGYLAEYECAEDFEFFLRLAEVGTVCNLPVTLYSYRQHPSSVGHSRRALQIDSTRRAVEAACRRRGLAPPTNDLSPTPHSSLAEIHRKWAWLALIGKNPRTARKHAFRAVCLEPWRRDNVVLLACSIRGY